MKMADYLKVLRGGWAFLLIAALLGALVGWGLSALQPRNYTSTTSLYISISDETDPASVFQMGEYMRSQMVSYAELAERPIVLEPAAEKIDADITAEELSALITVDAPAESYIMDVVAESDDPMLSAAASEAVAESLETQVEDVAPQFQDQALVDLSIVERPTPAEHPETVPWALWVGAGTVVGLVLGLLLAFLRWSIRADSSRSSGPARREQSAAPQQDAQPAPRIEPAEQTGRLDPR